ncbi:hypothetical protein ABZV67_20575 [Streptomyces sp. NPDC005065]|uniref:hypothetical protein n=1 Tax=Streptomyces sp. NPDC005065 TaxID=3154461 RepID=UPI0033AA32E4
MPVPSETELRRAGLPVIDLAAARVLFRTAESSGLGRPGTDELFDLWLGGGFDIAFYRNADQPLQARAAVDRAGDAGALPKRLWQRARRPLPVRERMIPKPGGLRQWP